ncbi:MAG: leucine-rich repeat protein [Clostridia bacterium]|nr:leucine-rich repeat protein [Clostridia bacterium]
MNKKKLLSFILCFCILLSCLFFSGNVPTAVGGTTGVYESQEPVTPPESDFTYRKIPLNAPTKAVITKYIGNETKVIIPETLGGLTVTGIANNAFKESTNLTYVKLPSTLETLSARAFSYCSELTDFDIDASNQTFTVIDGVVYRKNTNTESATYGKITTLSAFPAGKSGKFTIPYGVESIASYAFERCYNLTSVDMYNTVTTINSYAFSHCWNLKEIRLSDNLKQLGAYALAYCDSLTRIDLPSNLTNIGSDAVLGGIDSDSNKFYYFIDGISCTQGSYAYDYLVKQALPKDIIIVNKPSITDNTTGIKLIDAYGVLPENKTFDISVETVKISDVKELFPTRYEKAFAFDIDVVSSGNSANLDGNVIFNFDAVCPDAIPSATKVYQQIGDELVLVSGLPHAPFVCAQVSEGGRFVILINNDFSLKGDVDGDGVVTLFDAKATLFAATKILALTQEQRVAANVYNSSSDNITTTDAQKILRLAGGMEIK